MTSAGGCVIAVDGEPLVLPDGFTRLTVAGVVRCHRGMLHFEHARAEYGE